MAIRGIYVDIDFKILIWRGVFNAIKPSIIRIRFRYLFEYACVVVVMTGAIRDIETGDRLILTLNFTQITDDPFWVLLSRQSPLAHKRVLSH
ncbi:Uncharacterised protein [Vibrio cholerae]|nr:Uncharacterised protein [Vibrio cholerae]